MKRTSLIILAVILAISLIGCSESKNKQSSPTKESTADTAVSNDTANESLSDLIKTDSDMFTERDSRIEYNINDCINVYLSGDTATADSESVLISNGKITITENKTHVISGSLNDGMLIVDADESAKLQIVLNNASVTSKTSAALYVLQADKVFLTTAPNTHNSLINGGSHVAIDENNIDGAIFSKQDITLNGEGELTVTSPAGHGIVAKDDLVITGGTYNITSASHGITANNSVRINGTASISVNSGKDGIHSENDEDSALGYVYISNGSYNIEAQGDGISAGSYAQISNANIKILAGGGYENGNKANSNSYGEFGGGFGGPGGPGERPFKSSEVESVATTENSSTSIKGIKAQTNLIIQSGDFEIDSADDSLHSNTNLYVLGGDFNIASGDDAMHAEEILKITKGNIEITNSYEGIEALNIEIIGGNIKLCATDDGLNAAGGVDSSGTSGGRDGMFGRPGGGDPGGMFGNSNGSILISGGEIYIKASGDGIDANGKINISGSRITVVGPTSGDTSTLDYDTSASITGGTFIGTGARGMAQSFSSSAQGVIALTVGNQTANTNITITDTAGNILISVSPELGYQVVIISCPKMVKGESYLVTIGETTDTFTAN